MNQIIHNEMKKALKYIREKQVEITIEKVDIEYVEHALKIAYEEGLEQTKEEERIVETQMLHAELVQVMVKLINFNLFKEGDIIAPVKNKRCSFKIESLHGQVAILEPQEQYLMHLPYFENTPKWVKINQK